MRLVVPREKPLAMASGILDATEAVREIRPVLQRFELRLGIGVVVRDIGPTMGFGDIQIDQQGSHRLAAHAGTPVGMYRQRVRRDVVLGHRLGDQLLGQFGGFPQGDHPADDIAAENIQDHIQVEAGPFGRAFEFRDIPAPDLVGGGGQEFRLGIDRVYPLAPAFSRLAVRLQGAVQGAHRADVAPLVQQGGIDKIRRAIGEAFAVEHIQQLLPLEVRDGYPPGYGNGYTAPVYGNGGYVAYPAYGRQAYRNPYYPEGRRGWGGGGREERREHEWREHNGWGGRGWGGRYGRD